MKKININIQSIILGSLNLPIAIQTLYWLLLLIPGRSSSFYVITSVLLMLLIMLSLYFYSKKNLLTCHHSENQIPVIVKPGILVVLVTSAVLIFGALIFLPGYLSQPLEGHDILVYGNEGKIYYRDKSLNVKYTGYDEKSGIAHVSRHSPHFPLILTFEKMIREITGISQGDAFFKLVTPVSWVMIILSLVLLFYQYGTKFGLLVILSLLSSYLFLLKPMQYHIDMYRMYFMTMSIIMLYYAIEYNSKYNIILLAFVCGASAAIHSIGTITSVIIMGLYFVFSHIRIKERVINTLVMGLIFILMGGGHYIINFFHGNRWLFK